MTNDTRGELEDCPKCGEYHPWKKTNLLSDGTVFCDRLDGLSIEEMKERNIEKIETLTKEQIISDNLEWDAMVEQDKAERMVAEEEKPKTYPAPPAPEDDDS